MGFPPHQTPCGSTGAVYYAASTTLPRLWVVHGEPCERNSLKRTFPISSCQRKALPSTPAPFERALRVQATTM